MAVKAKIRYYQAREEFIEDFNIYFKFCGINDIDESTTDDELKNAYRKAQRKLHPDNHKNEEERYTIYFQNMEDIMNKYNDFLQNKNVLRNTYDDPNKQTQQTQQAQQTQSRNNSRNSNKKQYTRTEEDVASEIVNLVKSKNKDKNAFITHYLRRAKDENQDIVLVFKNIYTQLNEQQLEKKYFDDIWSHYINNIKVGFDLFFLAEQIAIAMNSEDHIYNFIATTEEYLSENNASGIMMEGLPNLLIKLVSLGKIKEERNISEFCDIFTTDSQIQRLVNELKNKGFREGFIYNTIGDIGEKNHFGPSILEMVITEFKPDTQELFDLINLSKLTDSQIKGYLESNRKEFCYKDIKLELISKLSDPAERYKIYEKMKRNREVDWKDSLRWDAKIPNPDEVAKKQERKQKFREFFNRDKGQQGGNQK